MNLLDTQNIDNKTINFYYSEHIALKSVLSSILRNYSDCLDKKYMVPVGLWKKLDDARAVYATDSDNNLLGGICFIIDKVLDISSVFIVFKEGESYTKPIHGFCWEHFKNISKEENVAAIVQHIHKNNNLDIDLAEHVKLSPTYYFLTQSLADNDEE